LKPRRFDDPQQVSFAILTATPTAELPLGTTPPETAILSLKPGLDDGVPFDFVLNFVVEPVGYRMSWIDAVAQVVAREYLRQYAFDADTALQCPPPNNAQNKDLPQSPPVIP
jgi:hypothetical protein